MDFFHENVVLYSKSMDLGCFQGLKLEDARQNDVFLRNLIEIEQLYLFELKDARQNDVRLQNSIDIRCLCTSKCEDAPLKMTCVSTDFTILSSF